MSLNRRQLLQWGGAIAGFSLSACMKGLTNSETVGTVATPTAESVLVPPPPPATPSPTVDPLTEQGIFSPPRGDVRLVVISDFNGSYGSTTYDEDVQRAIALLPAWQPDIVISGGDMVAGQSKTLARERIEAMWAGFDTYIAEPLRQANLPFGFTVGNHDASRAVGVKGLIYQQERDLAAAYWNDPAHDPRLTFVDRAKFPFYYSFQHKDVFYLVWDASSGLKMPAEEVAWVEQSLSSDLAQSAKLRIVIGHLPLYAVAVERDRIGEVLGGAEELHALLERYSVHTYVSGHHHAYYPGHLGQLQFLHAGAIGSGPRQLLTSSLSPRKTVTVVDINLASADTIYTTYDMKDMQVVEFAELPRAIASHNGFVMRRDLAWTNLSPDEQAACIQRLSEARCQTPL